jgi:RNA polymerase sigma factor (sigma-70 family)
LEEQNMASALAQRHSRHIVKGRAEDLPDDTLLEQFLHGGETDAQEAFRALVVRHGPMVLGICRHVLNEDHDAEDAFQATFLVLAQKGSSIRNRRVLAGWLHEVAHRIAIKARFSTVRRRTLERQAMAMAPSAVQANNQDEAAAWNELRPVLHAEVDRLPEKYRLPVILCYLEGKTNEEVADLLHWPVGTVKGRLSRARDLLRSRLVRRGLGLSAAFLLTALSQGRVFAEIVPAELVKDTVRLARKFGARPAGLSLYSSEPVAGPEKGIPARVELLSRAAQHLAQSRRVMTWLFLAFVIFSTFLGVSLAATSPGGFSSLRKAFSSMMPGAGAPCH